MQINEGSSSCCSCCKIDSAVITAQVPHLFAFPGIIYQLGGPGLLTGSIMLEELVEAGDLTEKFEVHSIDLMAGEHLSPEFSALQSVAKIS
jgi:hypothetical protein